MVRRMSVATTTARPKLARKLAAYSAAAVAATALADRAQAEPIPYTPPGGPQTFESTGINVINFDIDLDGDGQFDFFLQAYLGFRLISLQGTTNQVQLDPNVSSMAWIVPAGETIGPEFTSSNTGGGLDQFIGTRGFVGVQFDIPGGSPHFGYLDIEIDNEEQFLTLYGGAYESQADTPITTVPEPSSLGLLALGAAGLAAWRCRRKGSNRTASA